EGPVAAVLGQGMTVDPPPPSTHRPGLAPELEAICRKAMAKEPQDRYGSMAQFAGALGDWLKRPAPTSGTETAFPINFVLDDSPPATFAASRKRTPPFS